MAERLRISYAPVFPARATPTPIIPAACGRLACATPHLISKVATLRLTGCTYFGVQPAVRLFVAPIAVQASIDGAPTQ